MALGWQELTKLTGGREIVVERVKLVSTGISIEGEFELSPLIRLSAEDQVFLAAFVRSHGSIKQMEKYFGISYPTVKNRLTRIADKLEFIEINPEPTHSDVIEKLQRGEITVDEALDALGNGDEK